MILQTTKQIVRRFIEECLNKQNPDAAPDSLVAEGFVEELPFPHQGPGRAGQRDALRGFIVAFPDMHWKPEEEIAEGDKVVTRFSFTATHGGEFIGMPATNKHVETWGVVIDVV